MKLQLRHPKILLALLIAIAAVTAVGLLFASGGDDKEITFTPVPVERSIPVVSEESLQEALAIAKTSGVVESISGGQKWTYDFVSVARVGGAEAVSFDVQWEEPVASSGPWSLVWCKNTRKLITPARWTNVTRLEVIVDVENDEVVAYAPMGHLDNQPVLETDSHRDGAAKVYDTASGALVFEGTNDRLSSYNMCPPGKENDEIGR